MYGLITSKHRRGSAVHVTKYGYMFLKSLIMAEANSEEFRKHYVCPYE
jgi:hypothetical protein